MKAVWGPDNSSASDLPLEPETLPWHTWAEVMCLHLWLLEQSDDTGRGGGVVQGGARASLGPVSELGEWPHVPLF